MKKKKIQDELNELSPFLSNLKKDKKEGFSMPANYFENFDNRLMGRIQEEEALSGATSSNSTTSLPSSLGFWAFMKSLIAPKYALGFATCAILLVVGLQWTMQEKGLEKQPLLLAELTLAETNEYIINNLEEFETEDIVASLETEDVEQIQNKISVIEKDLDSEPSLEKTEVEEGEKSSMDKALEKAGVEDFLDDLTEEDLEDDVDGLF